MTQQLEQLLADGRVRQINPGALVPLYETVHSVESRLRPYRGQPRGEDHLKHSSPRTKPSLTSRRHNRRRRNHAARRARRLNRSTP